MQPKLMSKLVQCQASHFPYEDWENPNLILPTHELDVDECIDKLINVLKEQSILIALRACI